MKVAFFGTKNYEQAAFHLANQTYQHGLTFFEPRMQRETARLAEGFEAVCVFVNDQIAEDVVIQLADYGVKVIALRCAGFNNVDLAACGRRGVTVVRVPAYSPHAVAEHSLALILTLNRRTHKAYNRVREGNFSIEGLIGFDLYGKQVGVIGAGKIGQCLVNILMGFGCSVRVFDPMVRLEENPLLKNTSLAELLAESDIISLHCPLTPQTKHIINEATIESTKKNVMIINTSRGGLVDTKAVIKGLKSGKIGFLGLDVYEEEEGIFFADNSASGIEDDTLARLLTFPQVLVTGHQAFLTREALANIADTTLANLTAIERGQVCPNEVKAC